MEGTGLLHNFSIKSEVPYNYFVGIYYTCLVEAFLIDTHNIWFKGELMVITAKANSLHVDI